MIRQIKVVTACVVILLLCSTVNIKTVYADSEAGRFKNQLQKCSIDAKPCSVGEKVNFGQVIRFSGSEDLLKKSIDFKYDSLVFLDRIQVNTYKVMMTINESAIIEKLYNIIGYKKRYNSAANMTKRGSWPIRVFAPSDDKSHATLITGVPIKFTWCSTEYKRFVIKKDGRELYAADTTGRQTVSIPAGIFKEAGRYEFVAGEENSLPDKNSVVVKDEDESRLLHENLAKITKKSATPKEAVINKVIYLQALTDLMPEKWQLDWYACQLLTELNAPPESVTCRLTELEKICQP